MGRQHSVTTTARACRQTKETGPVTTEQLRRMSATVELLDNGITRLVSYNSVVMDYDNAREHANWCTTILTIVAQPESMCVHSLRTM